LTLCFFSCLSVIFILLPAGQSHRITQVYIFFLPLVVIIVFICWKLITAIKRYYMSCGCEVTSYLRQIIHTFCNKLMCLTELSHKSKSKSHLLMIILSQMFCIL
jgi:hypothetical protein